MFDVKLVINGVEFPVHYRLLREIADNFPAGTHYYPLAKALLGLNLPSIARKLVENTALTCDDMDKLWQSGDIEVQRQLIQNESFRKNLTDAQAEMIIGINDTDMLKELACWAEELYPCKDEEQALRLSGKMADSLMGFMMNHKDESVRRALAQNGQIPTKFRTGLKEIIRQGGRFRPIAMAALTMDDVTELDNAPANVLRALATCIEDIEDREVKARVGEYLCNHPDPEIRLELAENWSAPRSILSRLAKDEDRDIAFAAIENRRDDYDDCED